MILEIFSVFDFKAAAYGQPFFTTTRGLALRMFQDECSNEGSNINRHSDDFTLTHIGTYDDTTGQITPHKEGPEPVMKAAELLALLQEGKSIG